MRCGEFGRQDEVGVFVGLREAVVRQMIMPIGRKLGQNGTAAQPLPHKFICSTVFERSGSTAANVPTNDSVWVTPRACVRATFEKVP